MPRKYLVVDDAPVIRSLVTKLLHICGVPEEAIATADDGDRALEVFHDHEPDVVFMDISMPGMSGAEAATAMLDARPETKIIALSVLDRSDERVMGIIASGAFDILQKPVHSEDIRRIVNLLDHEEGGAGRSR